MSVELAQALAAFRGKGYVIAPAGYGKTHLIASAVRASSKRQLILTHTYAGVAALQKKMQTLGVPASRYQIHTIASWALQLCLYYPKTSGWTEELPTGEAWGQLYGMCEALIAKPFICRFIKSSYDGFYVDEYQDCSIAQHRLVQALAGLLPCRILGDPLQAIFDFTDEPVDWATQIFPHYAPLGELNTPWRWHKAGATELAAWLGTVRERLLAGKPVSLRDAPSKSVRTISVDLDDFKNPKRLNFFYSFLQHDESVIAIQAGDQKSKGKTHQLARLLNGKFSSIEEVEGKDLQSFLKKLDGTKSASTKLCLAIEFSKKCITGIDRVLSEATKRGDPVKLTKATKSPEIALLANDFLTEPSNVNLNRWYQSVLKCSETVTFRRDLMNRLMKVLRINADHNDESLLESFKRYQTDFRRSGRPLRHNKLIGTTLLVKGLEYDHAIVLNGGCMSAKELYVALTRGAKSVTIVSSSQQIQHRNQSGS